MKAIVTSFAVGFCMLVSVSTAYSESCDLKPKYCTQMAEVEVALKPVRDGLRTMKSSFQSLVKGKGRTPASEQKKWLGKIKKVQEMVEEATLKVDRGIKTLNMGELSPEEHKIRIATIKLVADEVREVQSDIEKLKPSTVVLGKKRKFASKK